MIGVMTHGLFIQAWRLSKGRTSSDLATQAGLSMEALDAMESGDADPSGSALRAVAGALGIPTAWLFEDPKHMDLLFKDSDGEQSEALPIGTADPIIQRILLAVQHDRSLYVLLTTLIQSGDPKLLRAAEASLRSLVKQSRQATVPWQSRPPGHFEPPSD